MKNLNLLFKQLFLATILIVNPCIHSYAVDDTSFKQIKDAVPDGVNIMNISKYDRGFKIKGISKKNKDLSLFMRNISSNGIGSPSLDSLRKTQGGNEFYLRIVTK